METNTEAIILIPEKRTLALSLRMMRMKYRFVLYIIY